MCGGNNEVLVPASCSAAIQTLRAAAQCFLIPQMRQLFSLLAALSPHSFTISAPPVRSQAPDASEEQ